MENINELKNKVHKLENEKTEILQALVDLKFLQSSKPTAKTAGARSVVFTKINYVIDKYKDKKESWY